MSPIPIARERANGEVGTTIAIEVAAHHPLIQGRCGNQRRHADPGEGASEEGRAR